MLALGVLLLLRDVSRETQLNRLRSDFVSGVSHELKTPLTLIRLYTETLLEEEQFRPEERKGFYQIILRESERLTHLIERALDFARVDRREKQYHLERGNLAPFIAQTVQVYGEYLKRRGFSVETNLAPDLACGRVRPGRGRPGRRQSARQRREVLRRLEVRRRPVYWQKTRP